MPAKVAAIEYDPNRSAHIALLHYADGEKRYILAPRAAARGGDGRCPGENADIQPGNALPLRAIPTGTTVHNVELTPGRGGQLGRSAGTAIQLVAKEGKHATLRLPSGEMRMVPRRVPRHRSARSATPSTRTSTLGKAGRSRHKGKRPQTRGTAMNPVDHPHGGGEGSTTAGRHPVTPWGVPTLGYRTRKKNKASDRYIVRGRRRGKKGGSDEPLLQEGPVGRGAPDAAHRGDERVGRQADGQDLVADLARSSPRWSATRSPSTTAASTCPCSSRSRWSATSSASSRPTRVFRGHAGSEQGEDAMSRRRREDAEQARRGDSTSRGRGRAPRSRGRGRSAAARRPRPRPPRRPRRRGGGRGEPEAEEQRRPRSRRRRGSAETDAATPKPRRPRPPRRRRRGRRCARAPATCAARRARPGS